MNDQKTNHALTESRLNERLDMIELLQRIFIGHNHKWVRMENVNVKGEHCDNYAGAIIIQQCETCGKLKNHKVKW